MFGPGWLGHPSTGWPKETGAGKKENMVLSQGIALEGEKRAEIVATDVVAPAGSQVLIRSHAVGLCGSDIALYLGTYEGPRNYPIYFGHEWSGTVEAVGPKVTHLRPGDKVTGDCSIYCGACEFCARDRNLCQKIEKFGITIHGASRQFFLQDERYLYRADPGADLDLVALSEPLAVGAHAVRRVRQLRPRFEKERVLVLGGGTIGLSCFFALKQLAGCEYVELYDLVESRVVEAVGLGAAEPTDVVAGGPDAEGYGGLYSGRGYDVIFETSGAPAAFLQAAALLRPLGTIMALGFVPSVPFSPKQITLKAAQVMGSIGGTGEFEQVLAFSLRRPDLVQKLITHRVPFEGYDRAFDLALDRRGSRKVLVHFERE
jgi:threonine dehydrogenase-like Zn-dependent dehydrogenase